MAIYQWVGGFTGHTGPNSGYSLTGGGTFGVQPKWTSQIDGSVSLDGDFVYGPFAWHIKENWRKAVAATGSIGNYNYIPATQLPKGGDTVWFSGGFTSGTGQFVNTYSVSCKYGGMSGDGFTASGQTAWAGGYTANGDKFGNITFIVKKTFGREEAHPYLQLTDTGGIGVGANPEGDFSNFAPLTVRFANFVVSDGSTGSFNAANVAINNISTAGTLYFNNDYFTSLGGSAATDFNTLPHTHGTMMIKGNYEYVEQSGGYLYITDASSTTTGGVLKVSGKPIAFSSNSTTSFERFAIIPVALAQSGYIYGNSGGTVAELTIGSSFTSSAPITLGGLNDNTTPAFTEVTIGQPTTLGLVRPTIKLASCQIDILKCEDGNIAVSELNGAADYPIIRDGYMKSGTLDMAHPLDSSWQQFLLGYSPSDNGLRIDNPNQVTLRGYAGASFKTGTAEAPFSATGSGGF